VLKKSLFKTKSDEFGVRRTRGVLASERGIHSCERHTDFTFSTPLNDGIGEISFDEFIPSHLQKDRYFFNTF